MGPSQSIAIFLSQMAMMVPSLLVYGFGIILAVMWRRRAPRAALMAGVGLALMALTGVGATIAQAYLMTKLAPSQLGPSMMITGVVSSILRAVGLGLLVVGAFADRGSVRASGFEVGPSSPVPPLAGLASEAPARP